jgi:hypothetical protein
VGGQHVILSVKSVVGATAEEGEIHASRLCRERRRAVGDLDLQAQGMPQGERILSNLKGIIFLTKMFSDSIERFILVRSSMPLRLLRILSPCGVP